MSTEGAHIKTADICDRFAESVEVCEPMFTSYGAVEAFDGTISTVKVYEDNVLVREAMEDLAPGSVLVVDGGGSTRCALLGDKLASIAASRGLAGIIINGCVRDSRELAGIGVGILALASHPSRSKKEGKGERDVSVEFGGVTWTQGNYVYADSDGIVVAPEKLHEDR
ncbi:MAG TPA: ribonuclease E activity regulator RraA [Rubrobacter sp.]|nr:ribonuclease E activity regulator RraA [Rubrobacter sp.]